ncbi:unnamed protein product, partial [Symbiodinium sp. KB8]
MLASRVSELAEKHCAESETGYRRGRGCTDALVLMRRLFQEWRCSRPTRANGSNSLYVLFIDLTRAFDAVPRAFLWTLLQRKLGVPAHVVDLPKAIYTGMTTRVCGQRGQLSTSFQMSTGVRQGSIEGPVPFLLYFAVVLKVWRKRCDDALGPNHGVPWQSVIDGTLRLPTHLRRCASREHCFRDSVFADDTAIFATNWDDFCQMSELFHRTLSDMGGLLNAGKTEWLELHSFVGVPDIAPLPGTKILTIAGQHSKTAQFKYLGAVLGVDRTCGIDADVRRRVSLAHAVFSKLRHLWRARENSLKTKSRMLLSCVAAVLLYSSDTWSIQYPHHRLLHTTWMMFVRRAQRLKHSDMQTLRLDNDALLARLGVPSVFTLVARRTAQSESRLLAATLLVLTERECTLTVVSLCKWLDATPGSSVLGELAQALQAAPAAPAGRGSPVHKRARAAGQSANSQDALQAQQPTGGRADRARKPLVALANDELTLAFVSQQDQLDQLQLQCAAVFRFASDNVSALRLLAAVDQWKADLRPGRPDPLGACATAVALAVLFGLSDASIPPGCNEEAAKALQALVAELLAGEAAAVAREFSHCSARLKAKKEHIILDCRPTLYDRIFPFYNVLCQLLESFDAERLGRKPAGSLLRKAEVGELRERVEAQGSEIALESLFAKAEATREFKNLASETAMAILRELHVLTNLPVPLQEVPPETWHASFDTNANVDIETTGEWKRAPGHFVIKLEFGEASLRVQQGLQGSLGQWIGKAVKAAREKGEASFDLYSDMTPEELERKRKRTGGEMGTTSTGRGGGKGKDRKKGKGKGGKATVEPWAHVGGSDWCEAWALGRLAGGMSPCQGGQKRKLEELAKGLGDLKATQQQQQEQLNSLQTRVDRIEKSTTLVIGHSVQVEAAYTQAEDSRDFKRLSKQAAEALGAELGQRLDWERIATNAIVSAARSQARAEDLGTLREQVVQVKVVAFHQSDRDSVVQGLKEKGARLKDLAEDVLESDTGIHERIDRLQRVYKVSGPTFAASSDASPRSKAAPQTRLAKELVELGASTALSSVTNGNKPPEGLALAHKNWFVRNRWGSPDPRLLVMYLNLQGQEYAFVAVYIPSGQFYEQCRLRADVYDKATLLHRRLCDTKPWCLQIWGRRFTPVVIALLRQELRTPDADDSVRHRTTPPHRARQRLPPTTPWEIYTDGSCEVAVARGAADDRDVTVFFDSVFVCKMATGQWNPRSNSALVQRVQELVEQVPEVKYFGGPAEAYTVASTSLQSSCRRKLKFGDNSNTAEAVQSYKKEARNRWVLSVISTLEQAIAVHDMRTFYQTLPKLGVYADGRSQEGKETFALQQAYDHFNRTMDDPLPVSAQTMDFVSDSHVPEASWLDEMDGDDGDDDAYGGFLGSWLEPDERTSTDTDHRLNKAKSLWRKVYAQLEFGEASLRVQQGLQGGLGQWIGKAVKAAREKREPSFNIYLDKTPEVLTSSDPAEKTKKLSTELANGRLAMMAIIGMFFQVRITGKFPGYLSPSAGLKFADVPNGLAAISQVPAAGWGQILAYMAFCE